MRQAPDVRRKDARGSARGQGRRQGRGQGRRQVAGLVAHAAEPANVPRMSPVNAPPIHGHTLQLTAGGVLPTLNPLGLVLCNGLIGMVALTLKTSLAYGPVFIVSCSPALTV